MQPDMHFGRPIHPPHNCLYEGGPTVGTIGSVVGMRIPELSWGTIETKHNIAPVMPGTVLIGSDDDSVVPNEGIRPRFLPSGLRSMVHFYGATPGRTKLHVGEKNFGTQASGLWDDWVNPLQVTVTENPSRLFLATLSSPHMVLNASTIRSRYIMDFPNPPMAIPSGDQDKMAREDIIKLVVSTAQKAKGGQLNHLVFNCHHSKSNHLKLGTWFDQWVTPLYAQLKGLVKVIWLQACTAAYGPGEDLCKAIATSAKCHVVGYVNDATEFKIPFKKGQIDLDLQSSPKVYDPDGNVTVSIRRLPLRLPLFDRIEWTKRP